MKYDKAEFGGARVPLDFIHVYMRRNVVECQTLDLVKRNHHITAASEEAVMLSDIFVKELLQELRQYIPQWFRISEAIGLIDMIASFAQLVTTHEYSRPDFYEHGHLALQDARHPILDVVSDGCLPANIELD
jgi:DNA mismatch repair protein MSH4